MRKLILVLLFVCSTAYSTLYAQDAFAIRDLSGGKVDVVNDTMIPDNSVYDCRNVYFDEEYTASKRKGMTKLNSSAIGDGQPVLSQFEYKLSNGTRYHIAHSSETVYYRLAGSSFTKIKNGISSINPANYCIFMDTLTVVDGTHNMWSWDASTTFTQNTTYQPKYIIVWQNRIWIAGDSDELSKVRCCEYLDPSDWGVPSNAVATDPAVFDINSQDGQKVMGFALSPNGGLMIFKEKSVWEINGYDRNDFYLRLAINDIGCVDSRSVVSRSGQVTWLSERGYVSYNGQSYSIISDKIKTTVDSIQQLNPGSGLFQKDSESDWVTYSTKTFCDFAKSPGMIYPAFRKVQTNYSESQTGGNSSRQIVTDGNYIYSAYYGMYNGFNSMVVSKYDIHTSTYTEYLIKAQGRIVNNMANYFVINSSKTILSVVYYNQNSGSNYFICYASAAISDLSTWYEKQVANSTMGSLTLDLDSNNRPVILHTHNDTDLHLSSYTATNIWSADNVVSTDTWRSVNMVIDGIDTIHFVGWENINRKLSYASILKNASTMTKTTLSAILPTVDYLVTDIDVTTLNKPQIICGIQNETRGYFYDSSWHVDILENNGAYDGIFRILCIGTSITELVWGGSNPYNKLYYKRHLLANDTFSATNTLIEDIDYKTATVDLCTLNNDVFMSFRNYTDSKWKYAVCSSTNIYTSEIYNTGQTGTYYFDELISLLSVGHYDVTHQIRSDNSEANIATNTWTSVTRNTVPSITPKQYIQYRCIISTDCISDDLSYVDYVAIQYHGAAAATAMASMFYDDRIWNAVSISSATYLDRQLVVDKNGSWTDFTSAIGCSSLYNYGGTPYWGGNNGYVYTMNTGELDDTQPISSYILTKAYDMGTLVAQKTLDGIYVQADDSGNWNLTLDYFLDRSLTTEETYNIDLDETPNLINYKIPFVKQLPFYTLQYKLSNNGSNEPWDLMGIYTYTRPLPLR